MYLHAVGLAGFPFVGADVGGFFDHPSCELFIRWMQVRERVWLLWKRRGGAVLIEFHLLDVMRWMLCKDTRVDCDLARPFRCALNVMIEVTDDYGSGVIMPSD